MYPRLVAFNRIRRDLDPADMFLNEHLADIFLPLADRGSLGSPLLASQFISKKTPQAGTKSGQDGRHPSSPPSGGTLFKAASSRILAARDVAHGRDPRHHGDDAYERMLQRVLRVGRAVDSGAGAAGAGRTQRARDEEEEVAEVKAAGALGPVGPRGAVGLLVLKKEFEAPDQLPSATTAPTHKGRRKRKLKKKMMMAHGHGSQSAGEHDAR